MRIFRSSSLAARLGACAGLVLALTAPAPANADERGDRQLLAEGGGDPYLMILFDTSGSMNWGTQCEADDRAAGRCSHDCPEPNCPLPRNGDDPDSKIYQAKEALYTVMTDPDLTASIHWGFASLNQDSLAVARKHWLYEVTAASGITTPAVPDVGWREVFGPQTGGSGNTAFDMTCERDTIGDGNSKQLYETGCYMTRQDAVQLPADDDYDWTVEKVKRLPKGGADGTSTVTYFMADAHASNKDPDYYYRLTYGGQSSAIAYESTPSFDVTVTIDRCAKASVGADKTSCSAWSNLGTRTVTYSRQILRYDDDGDPGTAAIADPHLGPFLWWEGSLNQQDDYSKDAYYGGRTDGLLVPTSRSYASGIYADKTCRGWEPSNGTWGQRDVTITSETDPYLSAYNLRYTYQEVPYAGNALGQYSYDPPGTADDWMFEYGDVIPLHWDTTISDHKDELLKRLNPKHPIVDSDSFGQAPYFEDSYAAGEAFLRLATEDDPATAGLVETQKPLVAAGSTPLAGWFSMFRHWYSGCGDPGNCSDEFTGWSDIAAQFDTNFACSAKYVLMITDGEESCDGSGTGGTDNWEAEDYYATNIGEFPDGFSKTADQCRYRASLSAQEDIETLVIGFGTENKAKLQCANTPVYYADTKGELIDLLTELLGQIVESATTFASAAVPTVQANILDKVYLSSFVPLNDAAIWPGRLDAFLKPLPLDADNLPDRGAACDPGQEAQCFAWDAGDSQPGWNTAGVVEAGYQPRGLLLQAPLVSEISDYANGTFDNATLQLGPGEEERRVYFGLPDSTTQINRRQTFDFPADPDDSDDGSTEDHEPTELANYEYAWNLATCTVGLVGGSCAVNADCDTTDGAGDGVCTPASSLTDTERRALVADIVAFTLQEKQGSVDQYCTAGAVGQTCSANADCDSSLNSGDGICTADSHVQYLMGDVFHSNPLVLNAPDDFDLFVKNLYWGTPLCGKTLAETQERGPQISYSWYSNKNLCRRIGLFVGTDDGQLHAFDAGTFRAYDGVNDPAVDTDHPSPDCMLPLPDSGSGGLNEGNVDDDGVYGEYGSGTGRELFSFIPNQMMPVVKELSEITELTTQYGVDGTTRTADVFIDPYVTYDGNGDPVVGCEERVWRTVLLSNYREGGPGIFALDITQPDIIDAANLNVPTARAGSLDYVPACTEPGTTGCDTFCNPDDDECGDLAYPALKWEFRDLDENGAPADDDGNGTADLAESWSRPFVTRIQVCEGECDSADEPEDRWVAIFGGGLSNYPTNDANELTGNWLYMVDIETGKTVYKRGGHADPVGTSTSPIMGAVPADITGVDSNNDSLMDTIYFGTTAGFVYKVALGDGPFELDGDGQIDDGETPLGDPATGRFDPFIVFSTGGRPIYLEISAVYVPKMRGYALLFGTGMRWDLWDQQDTIGARFYALVDDNWNDNGADPSNPVYDGVIDSSEQCVGCTGPLTDANYPGIAPDSTAATTTYLYGYGTNEPGWYFTLGTNEKLITEPFTLSGITFFTIFDPLLTEHQDQCVFTGESKIFTVNTVTTEGYAVAPGALDRTRYITAGTFTTQPYVELSATKNVGADATQNNADSWTEELQRINTELRRLFPSGSRFANYTWDIKTIRSDTGIVFVAPVPIAIEPHNWKEF